MIETATSDEPIASVRGATAGGDLSIGGGERRGVSPERGSADASPPSPMGGAASGEGACLNG